jgi:hypothetical protein
MVVFVKPVQEVTRESKKLRIPVQAVPAQKRGGEYVQLVPLTGSNSTLTHQSGDRGFGVKERERSGEGEIENDITKKLTMCRKETTNYVQERDSLKKLTREIISDDQRRYLEPARQTNSSDGETVTGGITMRSGEAQHTKIRCNCTFPP